MGAPFRGGRPVAARPSVSFDREDATTMWRICLLVLLWCWSGLGLAAGRPVPAPPELGARAYGLMDFDSGRYIVARNIDQRVEPASITKLMTAYVVYKALADGSIGLDDMVTVSEKAWKAEGSRMFIEVGKQVSVRDLLHGLVIQSGNDAAIALAEHVAGSEDSFVSLMNQEAQRLGMKDTHFVNAEGLPDPEHYTTVRDIMTLTRALIREFPEHYALYKEKTFTYNKIKQSNRNRLLWQDPSVDGVKTGHTQSAGYCLVASARRNGMRLISAVFGTRNDDERTDQSRALLNYGFRFFETRKLYPAGEALAQLTVWKGAADTVPLGVREDIYITFPKGRYQDLDATMDRPRWLEAPVAEGQKVGLLTIALDGEVLRQAPLVALEAVDEAGLVGRLIDSVRMLWQ